MQWIQILKNENSMLRIELRSSGGVLGPASIDGTIGDNSYIHSVFSRPRL